MFDKSIIGRSFPPFSIEVERGKIRELALAIGDENPVYSSKAEAQAAGYDDVPIYPTTPTTFTFWGNRQGIRQLVSAGINVMRILHGEEGYEYLAPIHPGDTLTGVFTIVDGKTRQGSSGSSMDIITTEIQYTNQHDAPVLKARQVIVVRE